MLSTPFLGFYAIGLIAQASLNYLIKLGILVLSYIIIHFSSSLLFDERLMSLLPIAIYLATKVSENKSFIYIFLRIQIL